jgi:hypothetical protein
MMYQRWNDGQALILSSLFDDRRLTIDLMILPLLSDPSIIFLFVLGVAIQHLITQDFFGAHLVASPTSVS